MKKFFQIVTTFLLWTIAIFGVWASLLLAAHQNPRIAIAIFLAFASSVIISVGLCFYVMRYLLIFYSNMMFIDKKFKSEEQEIVIK